MGASEKTKYSSGGIGFFGLLQVAFIILKVTGLVDWSWWTVFIPLMINAGLFVLILLIAAIAVVINEIKEK